MDDNGNSKRTRESKKSPLVNKPVDLSKYFHELDIKRAEEFNAFHKEIKCEIDKQINKLKGCPIIYAYSAWYTRLIKLRPELEGVCLDLFADLYHINDDDPPPLRDISYFNHDWIIDDLRCGKTLSVDYKEQLVKTYISFINWVSEITFNEIKTIQDPDLKKTHGRVITYSMFIRFLEFLNDNNRLVAKLLYFGGTRTLEDVLELKLESVVFEKNSIRYGTHYINYPRHVLYDIKELVGKRYEGRVFLGRQNLPLNPSTIFRNFKEAGFRSGLGESFSPKMLTINA